MLASNAYMATTAPNTDLLTRNAQVLRSRINRFGMSGLLIALLTIITASVVTSLHMTGEITLEGILYARQHNFALRILDFLPFAFAFWGQYVGALMAYQASALVVEQTDDLRAETTAWKQKSLHDATHDVLTGLPNRVLFYDRLRQEMLVAGRENRRIAVLFVDLDGFKRINDAFGHDQGDLILKEVTARLRQSGSGTQTVARMGGDEFAILLTEAAKVDVAKEWARKTHRMLEQPFTLSSGPAETGVSIGIAFYPDHGPDADTIIQRSEAAMQTARRKHDGVAVYADELDVDNPRRVALLGELRRAIEQDKLELHYQPKVDLRTSEVVSVEALMRWVHPAFGRVSPSEFIALAEGSRLIRPLTQWSINRAARDLEQWQKDGLALGMAINFSARALDDPDLPALLAQPMTVLSKHPERITLEVTESSIMEDPRRTIEILKRLKAMKFRLSIDDFGTGYSSLAYLSKLPVSEMKIDKSFVMNMTQNRDDRTIVKATIDLGHNLGLSVVAEGVETEEDMRLLKADGCDIAQGYYISAPLANADFLAWLRDSPWKPKKAAQPG